MESQPCIDRCALNALSRLLACLTLAVALGPAVASPAGLTLERSISLPNVKGRIDHFTADVGRHRLFVAALGNDTVEVLDTAGSGRRSITGLGEPQGVLYAPESDRLVIANGSAGRVDIVNATSLDAVHRLGAMDDADNVRRLPGGSSFIVGYGRGALRIIDLATGQTKGDIPLPGHPESFQVDTDGTRAYVNVPSARAVVVVDLATRTAVARWDTPQAAANFPMALDVQDRRMFVGARSPAVVLVYDMDSGKVVSRVSIGGDTDDVFFDARRKRVYAICGEGRVDVIRQEAPDRYVVEHTSRTASHARTGLFVPEEGRLYVGAPASANEPARILVYRVD